MALAGPRALRFFPSRLRKVRRRTSATPAVDAGRAGNCCSRNQWRSLGRRILVIMKPARAATRRFLPASPFNTVPADPPIEQFAVQDLVTHDKYGLGRVIRVEDDTALVIAFGSRQVRILSPYAKLTKL